MKFWFNGLWGLSFELKLLPWRSDSVSERERKMEKQGGDERMLKMHTSVHIYRLGQFE